MKKLGVFAVFAAVIALIAIIAKTVKESYHDAVLDEDEDEYDDFDTFINVNDEGSIDVDIYDGIKEPSEETEKVSD